jgi:predicted nucleic acid-binding Zn ribbon protein
MSEKEPNEKISHIGGILGGLLEHNPTINKRMSQCQLWDKWPQIVGKSISNHAKPLRIKNTFLIIEVENSSWIQELIFQKETLLSRIHNYISEELITDLRFELKGRS